MAYASCVSHFAIPKVGLPRLVGERELCVPTDRCATCGATGGRTASPAGGVPTAFGAGALPGIGAGGPEPGKPDPAGGPLLVCTAGAPAVVPMALVCARVIFAGDGGAGGGPCGAGVGAELGGKAMMCSQGIINRVKVLSSAVTCRGRSGSPCRTPACRGCPKRSGSAVTGSGRRPSREPAGCPCRIALAWECRSD